ncbi:MAG: hypothetical protein JW910_13695, partial [Anaerolineae bacterium]|nr:hypothetical protein [Anaerolineae bacterium]
DAAAWIADGTWGLDANNDYGGVLGSGTWDASFYNLREYEMCGGANDAERASNAILQVEVSIGQDFNCNPSRTGTFHAYGDQTWPITTIDFACGTDSSPNPDGTCNTTSWKVDHDHMAISFGRWVTLDESTSLDVAITHNDGARLYVLSSDTDPRTNPVIDAWSDVTTDRTDSTTLNLAAGTYYFELWYYEESGPATFQLDLGAGSTGSFHDSPGGSAPPDGTPTTYQYNMALTYDGVLDLTGLSEPELTWYDFQYLASPDCVIAEVALPYEPDGFANWIEVYRACDYNEADWTAHNIPLRAPIEAAFGYASGTFDFTDALLTLRFRLDNRVGTTAGDGWWVDSVQVLAGTS